MTLDKEIKEFCDRQKITPAQFRGEEVIERHIRIVYTDIPQGYNPRTPGDLVIENSAIPANFVPEVGGDMRIEGVDKIPAGFAPVVGKCLYIEDVVELGTGFAPVVGYCLSACEVTNLPDGFNPVVGGYMRIPSVSNLPKDFNPLNGGEVYFDGQKKLLTVKELPHKYFIEARNGKYVIADWTLLEIVAKHSLVWEVKYVAGRRVFYLATDGAGKHALGETAEEALEFLSYK